MRCKLFLNPIFRRKNHRKSHHSLGRLSKLETDIGKYVLDTTPFRFFPFKASLRATTVQKKAFL